MALASKFLDDIVSSIAVNGDQIRLDDQSTVKSTVSTVAPATTASLAASARLEELESRRAKCQLLIARHQAAATQEEKEEIMREIRTMNT